jgi:hypothetical protein
MRNKLVATLVAAMLMALLAGVAIAGAGVQDVPNVQLSAFRLQLENHLPPHQAQVKVLLEGDDARPLGGGLILLINSRVASFSTNGTLEMEARAPRCVLDFKQHTVSSTGVLEIQTGDGASSVRGEGFLLSTNSLLTFSNRMTTVIRSVRFKSSKP